MQSAAVAAEVDQENPLIEGLERLPVRPTALVIFGATGDLAHRKLLPALYNLAHEGRAARAVRDDRRRPSRSGARGVPGDGARVDRAVLAPAAGPEVLDAACSRTCATCPARSTTTTCTARSTRSLREFDERAGQALNRVFYLSTAPQFFPVITGKLGAAGLNQCEGRGDADRDREAVRLRPRLGARSSTPRCSTSSTSPRCSGSTTTWARRPSRT